MSNCAYFASRTPSATFSKSQKTARLRDSGLLPAKGGVRGGLVALQPGLQALEVEVDDRRDVEREHLREQQAADDRQAKRRARAAAGAEADGDRQAAHQRGSRGHHDRPEAYDARLIDGGFRGLAVLAL